MNTNGKKSIKFHNGFLYIKIGDQEKKLGTINTRNGQLTRQQKLKAVEKSGEWVEI